LSSKIKPVLHYDFEHFTEDGKVEDLSGNGYHGTISGATRCEDQWGNPNSAMSFDGINDSIAVYNVNSAISQHGAVAFITKQRTLKASGIWHMYDETMTSDYIRSYFSPVGTYDIVSEDENIILARSSSSYLMSDYLNTFHCHFITHDVEGTKLFIDGIEISTLGLDEGEDIHWTNHLNDITLKLGNVWGYYDGILSNYRIYNQAPTPTQVKHISAQMMRKIGRQ
jgi:hypothetical protein